MEPFLAPRCSFSWIAWCEAFCDGPSAEAFGVLIFVSFCFSPVSRVCGFAVLVGRRDLRPPILSASELTTSTRTNLGHRGPTHRAFLRLDLVWISRLPPHFGIFGFLVLAFVFFFVSLSLFIVCMAAAWFLCSRGWMSVACGPLFGPRAPLSELLLLLTCLGGNRCP